MRYLLAMAMFLVACESGEIEKKTTSVVVDEGGPCVDEGLMCDLEDFEDAPMPNIVVEVKLDCVQVDSYQDGDICKSLCNLCVKGAQCIDTDGDYFGDTCTGVSDRPPAREPPPAVSTKKIFCGNVEIELGAPCSGAFGACAENGVLECINGQMTCSTDVKGSESLATEEKCGDNIDNDCNGIVDDTCSKPINDPSEEDKDGDGYKALVDCNDNDVKIVPGVNCPELVGLDKESYKFIFMFTKIPESSMVEYEETSFYYKHVSSSNEITGKLTVSFKFNAKMQPAVVDLATTDKYIRFNTIDAPGWWSTCGGAFAYGEQTFALNPNIKVYVIKNGVWSDVTSKVYALGMFAYEMNDSGNLCSAVLDL